MLLGKELKERAGTSNLIVDEMFRAFTVNISSCIFYPDNDVFQASTWLNLPIWGGGM